MKQSVKNAYLYVGMSVLFGLLIALIIIVGNNYFGELNSNQMATQLTSFDLFMQSVHHELQTPYTLMLLQIIAILTISRIFGHFFVKMGQPMVIGEVVAGIVLGPSLLGALAPETFNFLFGADRLGGIDALSKIGLVLFMFVIGMELDLKLLKNKINQTMFISHASIIIPFFLGMVLSLAIYQNYNNTNNSFLVFALFIGISMSITAFPVLARILQERNMIKSHLGSLAIASAANDDLTAWCVLAIVLAIAKASSVSSAIYTIIFALLYTLIMFLVVRPFMTKIGRYYAHKEVMNKSFMAFIFGVLIISSTITQIIGIHALFGAFVAGVVMSPNLRFRKIVTEKVEDISLVLFLPLFFVFTGLRLEIGLINSLDQWLMCGLFTLVAIIGKLGGGAISARLSGESWHNSLALGTLMNTRGLMELIVLNIGYDMGILPHDIFAMLVLMTLITTFMTGPMMNIIDWAFNRKNKKQSITVEKSTHHIILSFGLPKTGERLLELTAYLFGNNPEKVHVTALHLTKGTEKNPMLVEEYAHESFRPIRSVSERLKLPFQPIYQVTNNITDTILETSNDGDCNLLLVGAGLDFSDIFRNNTQKKNLPQTTLQKFWSRNIERITPSELYTDKTENFARGTNSDLGIYIYRGLAKLNRMIVILAHPEDIFILNYAREAMDNNLNMHVQIILTGQYSGIDKVAIRRFVDANPERVVKVNTSRITPVSYTGWDLVLMSYDGWKVISIEPEHNFSTIPSTLIINRNPANQEIL